jgi:Mg-chelatase subunit ChlI
MNVVNLVAAYTIDTIWEFLMDVILQRIDININLDQPAKCNQRIQVMLYVMDLANI